MGEEMSSRVLIVDDDPAICELMGDILSEVRMTGVSATKDIDAYRIISSSPTLKGLIVDINLGPGTTGFDVARFARQVIPTLPVVYITGAATEESCRAFGVPRSAFLQKPFDAGDLLATLLGLMNHPSGCASPEPQDQAHTRPDPKLADQ
jgi:DNA-binding NtrC family response regulator